MSHKKKNTNTGKSTKSAKTGRKKVYLVEEIYRFFQKNTGKVFNYKQVSSELDINDEETRILVNVTLSELAERGSLKEIERGKFKLVSSEKYVTGKADIGSGGIVFVISEDSEQDIFIKPDKTKNALQNDIVKVYVYPQRGDFDKKPEGEIVEIIERSKAELVGIIQVSQKFAFVVPTNSKASFDIFVPLDKINKAKNGEKVIVKITDWKEKAGQKPEGEVIDVLGMPGDNETEMHAILAEFGLPNKFEEAVEKFAENIPQEITEEEISKRRDFRDTLTFTIDPFDAKDFDDALSLKILPNGNYEIGVHIADVSHYLKEDTILDKEAVKRATSVYLVDRCIPMLPEALSNFLCSLRPHEEKLCFSAVFEINNEAQILTEWFGRTIINSDHRFTYEEAQKIIESQKKGTDTEKKEALTSLVTELAITPTIADAVMIFDVLAKILRNERFKSGAINFGSAEVKFQLDEKGKPLGTYIKETKDSNHLIEEFMLLANKKVAEFVGKTIYGKNDEKAKDLNTKPKGSPTFVYRVHDKPSGEKLSVFIEFVRRMGYQFKAGDDKTVANSMNELIKEVHGKGEQSMLESLAIRTMAKAHYTTENIGHYGLAFDYYSHFTSPIRRYPDVMVHRLLQHYLDGGTPASKNKYEFLCEHSSEREKVASDAERSSIKYKQVEFLKDRIGMIFSGSISGVTEWGIYVEIKENKCEGMIRMRDIPGDFFVYDDKNYCVYGKKTKKKYSIGDTVMVEVKRADLVKKQLDFLLITD